jgi:hypothetical protein
VIEIIDRHLALRNPRFRCMDVDRTTPLVVALRHVRGDPATDEQLAALKELAGPAYEALVPMYRAFDGLVLHMNGDEAGLIVGAIELLEEFNHSWQAWHSDLDPSELFEFQKHGFAFATVAGSGNYFILHEGRVYYSDHDGGDDEPWADDLESFFVRALSDPVRFLDDAGCHTRYSDGETDAQYIPEHFEHD